MQSRGSSFILGIFLFFGLIGLGSFIANGIVKFKELDRTVTVKGLSEKEVLANVVIMPIKMTQTSNDLEALIQKIDYDTNQVIKFLKENGLKDEDITLGAVSIVDKMANEFSNQDFAMRYLASKVINIYSTEVEKIRALNSKLSELSKKVFCLKQMIMIVK